MCFSWGNLHPCAYSVKLAVVSMKCSLVVIVGMLFCLTGKRRFRFWCFLRVLCALGEFEDVCYLSESCTLPSLNLWGLYFRSALDVCGTGAPRVAIGGNEEEEVQDPNEKGMLASKVIA